MIRTWIGVLVSVVAFVLVLSSVDLAGATDVLRDTLPAPVVAAVMLVSLQVILVSYRWSILLPRPKSGRPVGTAQTIAPVLVGYLGNIALPARLGDAARAVIIARRHGMSASETIGSVVLERIADTATGAVVALVLAVSLGAPAWVIQLSGLATIAAVVFVGLLTFFGVERLVERIGRRLHAAKPDLAGRVVPVIERLERGMRIQGRRPAVGGAAALSLGNWVLEGAIYWLVAESLGLNLTIAEAMLVAAVTVLATAIPAAPGYLGTFELAAVAVTTALGVPGATAFAFAVLVHAVTVLPLAIGGVGGVVQLGVSLGGIRSAAVAAERTALVTEPVRTAEPR